VGSKLTDEKIRLLKELREQKLPNKLIAQKLGVPPWTVSRWVKELGLPRYPKGMGLFRYGEKRRETQRKRIKKVYDVIRKLRCATISEVADHLNLNVHHTTISKDLRTLQYQGKIRRIQVRVGRSGLRGSLKYGGAYLFGDLVGVVLFFTDERALAERLLPHLPKNPSRHVRRALTSHLRSFKLSEEAIEWLYFKLSEKEVKPKLKIETVPKTEIPSPFEEKYYSMYVAVKSKLNQLSPDQVLKITLDTPKQAHRFVAYLRMKGLKVAQRRNVVFVWNEKLGGINELKSYVDFRD